jgi:hypothetical protein
MKTYLCKNCYIEEKRGRKEGRMNPYHKPIYLYKKQKVN